MLRYVQVDLCLAQGPWVEYQSPSDVKSVQSALSDLKRPLKVYSPSAIIGLSLLNSTLMARFLKQSFAQTCLKETDNGELQLLNYSRSLITNRGTVERGKIHSAHAMKQMCTQAWRAASKRMCFLELIVCQELVRQDNWPHCKELLCTTR